MSKDGDIVRDKLFHLVVDALAIVLQPGQVLDINDLDTAADAVVDDILTALETVPYILSAVKMIVAHARRAG